MSWKKAAKATGYEIRYGTKRSLRGGKTVKTRALAKAKGKTYRGEWSATKGARVEKKRGERP